MRADRSELSRAPSTLSARYISLEEERKVAGSVRTEH